MQNAHFLAQIVLDQITLGVLVLQPLAEGQTLRADGQANGVVLVLHLLFGQRVEPAVALLVDAHRHATPVGAITAAAREVVHLLLQLILLILQLVLLLLLVLTLPGQAEFAARLDRVVVVDVVVVVAGLHGRNFIVAVVVDVGRRRRIIHGHE